MPRKSSPEKRRPDPDPVFGSVLISRFVNCMMIGGKKATARRVFYDALERVADQTNDNPLDVFEKAMRNATPKVEVRPRRVGGATYQVPVDVREDRRIALAIRWMVRFARDRSGRSMKEKLAAEIMDAANNTGGACRRRDEMHKTAEANRAFSQYRW
ncbi:MAG: 30S ribosomal protein S7 [Armatimonadia bacterium]|nr:30S ribosomal protein S7 [Armatimonadia bacterium]